MKLYNERGLRITDLWNVNSRIISSIDTIGTRGGMEKGRVDMYPFYLDKNIIPIRVTLYWDDNQQSDIDYQKDEDIKRMWTELGVIKPPVPTDNGLHFEINVNLKEPTPAKGTGLVKIELDFVDNNDWVQVSHHPNGASQSNPFNIIPHANFQLCFVWANSTEYGTVDIYADVPLPLHNRDVKFTVNKSDYQIHFLQVGQESQALIHNLSGNDFETLFLRYF